MSTDELLGLKPVKTSLAPKKARFLKRLKQVESLPADQRAILKFVDALLAARRG